MDYYVTLDQLEKELPIEPIYKPDDVSDCLVKSTEVNRAGLLLTGFTEHFASERIEICGNVEIAFLNSLGDTERLSAIDLLFREDPPAVIVAGSNNMDFDFTEFMKPAKKYGIPLYHSKVATSELMYSAISFLNVELAPRITRHGVLVEVYGEGILILGDSGIGKSEAAIELVKRGHRFVADDAVELRRVSSRSIIGSAPENIKHYIELRGIGIINVMRIFGMGAIKPTERIDLVVQLEQWDPEKSYTKLGFGDDETYEILDVHIPCITVPVRPGRNLAVIIETAAMNNREKKLGYNSAEELMNQLGLK